MYVILVAKPSREIDHLIEEIAGHGFSCTLASNTEALFSQLNKEPPDLLLVELFGTPELDQIYRELKQEKNLPVIALTTPVTAARLSPSIDDFVMAPYNPREIVLRAQRLMQKKSQTTANTQIKVGDIAIDVENYEVYVNGRLVPLTFREYELLKCLADSPGRVFTREALLNRVWGQDYLGGDRTVDVHIRRLRSKIENPEHIYIDTVRNIGYRLKKS